MGWKDGISGWFGVTDRRLAIHPSDEKAAKAAIRAAKKEGASYEDVEKEVVYFLFQSVPMAGLSNHLPEQITKLKKLWG